MEAIKTSTTEVFLEGEGVTVTATQWSNFEGVNLIITAGKDMGLRMSGSLRWEEADLLLACLAAARAA